MHKIKKFRRKETVIRRANSYRKNYLIFFSLLDKLNKEKKDSKFVYFQDADGKVLKTTGEVPERIRIAIDKSNYLRRFTKDFRR